MFELISITVALGVGFACGYGVRELKSQRRRAATREAHLRKQEQKRYDQPNDAWISPAPGLSDTDCALIVPEARTRRPITKQALIQLYEADIRQPTRPANGTL